VLELPATGWLRRYRVRAHGTITQDKLDALRGGITISGIHYGAIEAAIDRVQGTNLWLTFAIREGKNREVRTVLAHLGLEVTRLIRVSFGPFQLGSELEEGAVEEVRTRVLREQLGEKLIAMAELDFTAPVTKRAEPEAEARRESRPRSDTRVTPWAKKSAAKSAVERPKQKRRSKGAEHAWRAHDEERPGKKLRRKFHGAQAGDARPHPPGKVRAGSLSDRKGRSVAVERYGEPPAREEPRQDFRERTRFGEHKHERKRERPNEHPSERTGKRPGERPGKRPHKPSGRRRAPDRARGARPRHPKGRD
jgi:23S rRNA pseudouridine2605 synthase